MPDGSTTTTQIPEDQTTSSRASAVRTSGATKAAPKDMAHAPAGAFDFSKNNMMHTDVIRTASSIGAAAMTAVAESQASIFNLCGARMEAGFTTARDLAKAGSPGQALAIQSSFARSAIEAYSDYVRSGFDRMSGVIEAARPKR